MSEPLLIAIISAMELVKLLLSLPGVNAALEKAGESPEALKEQYNATLEKLKACVSAEELPTTRKE